MGNTDNGAETREFHREFLCTFVSSDTVMAMEKEARLQIARYIHLLSEKTNLIF